MAPRRKRQEAGRTAKMGGTIKCGGTTQKEQEKAKQVRVGVSCYYLSYVLFKNNKKKTRKNDDDGKKTKGRENEPKKTPDLTSREFFRHFRERTAKKLSKSIGKNPPKNTRPTTTTKNQSSLPKIFSKNDP